MIFWTRGSVKKAFTPEECPDFEDFFSFCGLLVCSSDALFSVSLKVFFATINAQLGRIKSIIEHHATAEIARSLSTLRCRLYICRQQWAKWGKVKKFHLTL